MTTELVVPVSDIGAADRVVDSLHLRHCPWRPGCRLRPENTRPAGRRTLPAWVRWADRAHVNLVEQFAAFAGLVVVAHLAGSEQRHDRRLRCGVLLGEGGACDRLFRRNSLRAHGCLRGDLPRAHGLRLADFREHAISRAAARHVAPHGAFSKREGGRCPRGSPKASRRPRPRLLTQGFP